jgi:hypothetical protein
MLFRKNVIEAVAEVLEGLHVSSGQSVLVYGGKRTSGDMPLVELTFGGGRGKPNSVQIASALGIVELSAVEQVHISVATREAAFIAKASGAGKITMVTVSSSGILQVYSNIARSISSKDFAKISTDELRAAIALKVFTEGGKKFE